MDNKTIYSKSLQRYALLVFCLIFSAKAFTGGALVDPDPFDIPDGAYQANYVEEVDGVSVIEFSGDYNRSLPNDEFNSAARAVVAQEFYANNPDNYDFLVVYTDFEFDTGEATAFHIGVANDTQGIGIPSYSNRALFGSASALDGYIDMASIDRYQTNPLSNAQANQSVSFTEGLRVLAHETLHQWGISTEIEDFQGRGDAHWNFFMDTDASVEYGHDWRDNQDGTFTAESAQIGFSKLDLYLMGLAAADEVPDTFVITPSDDEYDRNELPRAGITVSGTRTDYTIEDFIEVHGERVPSSENAPKTFRYAFVYLTSDRTQVVQADIERINTIRRAYEDRFAILTKGRAIAQVYPAARVEASPGQFDTTSGGEQELADALDINAAITWLESRQDPTGFWQDMPATTIRDTVTVAALLEDYGNQAGVVQGSRTWLSEQTAENTDSFARVLLAGVLDNSASSKLAAQQRSDGGWSLSERYQSSVMDTALSVCALTVSNGAATSAALDAAMNFLESKQNADGGWGSVEGATSSINVTAEVLHAYSCLQKEGAVVDNVLTWLANQIRSDSGFGDDQSTVHETARVLQAFLLFDSIERIPFVETADFIIQRQSVNGDWAGSVYTTALAVDTLQSLNFPNLRVVSITQEAALVRDGDFVQLTSTIQNDSRETIPAASVRFARIDNSSNETVIQTVALPLLPPFSTVNVTAIWNTFGFGGTNTIRVIVDPDNQIIERLESDNQSDFVVQVESPAQGVELSVSGTEFDATPDRINRLPTDLEFSATLRNIGDTNAENVLIQLLLDRGDSNPELLQSTRLDVSARSNEGVSFVVTNDESGDLTFILRVDSDQAFDEVNETNNEATVLVASESGADLEISDQDITLTPSSLFFNQNGQLSVVVRNNGTSTISNAKLNITAQNRTGETPILESELLFAPGEQRTITANWLANFDGESNIIVELDRDNMIAELDENNNQATFSVTTRLAQGANLSVSPADLSFNPSPGLEGMSAALSAIVRNSGTQTVPSVSVRFFDGNPESGGVLIAQTNLASLATGASATAEVVWPQVTQGAVHFIYAVVETSVDELSNLDNVAFERFDVVSLPDFAISPESIQVEPRFPRAGDPTTFSISITNRGRQPGENINVVAHLGDANGREIATSSLNVPASGDIVWEFTTTLSELGESSVFIQVDPDDAVAESDESNNTALRSVLIQDGNSFISNLYLSPNGDSVNETVDYSFTLDAPSQVSVIVRDRYDNVVREFKFGDEPITGQLVIWDGLNSNGGRAADGLYRFAVRDSQGTLTAERSVTVDTNRSPLSEALGTRFSLTRNLSCQIGDTEGSFRNSPTSSIVYGPRDEFVYFTTFFRPVTDADGNTVITDENTLFPTGLYRASLTGSDVTQLVSDDELSFGLPLNLVVSPDGTTLAFTLGNQVWVVDSNGENLLQLDTGDVRLQGSFGIQFLDNDSIVFESRNNGFRNISKISISGANGVEVLTNYNGDRDPELFSSSLVLNRLGDVGFTTTQNAYRLVGQRDISTLEIQRLDSSGVTYELNNAGSYQFSPTGSLIAVASSTTKSINLHESVSGAVSQTFDFGTAQANQYTDDEQRQLSEFFFAAANQLGRFNSSELPDNLFDGLIGKISTIEWNPDASEFVFVFEDYLASIANSDGCGVFLDDSIGKSNQNKKSLLNGLFDVLIQPVYAGQDFEPSIFTNCIPSIPENIQELLDRYQTLDGIYLAKLSDSSIELVAKTSTVNASFGSLESATNTFVPDLLNLLVADDRFSQNSLNTQDNEFGFPITPDNYPYIEFAGASRLYRSFDTIPLRTLHWLNGGRELLITNGDESQYYNQHGPESSSNPFDTEELNPSDLAANNTVLLNLDNAAEETLAVFTNRDLITHRQARLERSIRPSNTGNLLVFQSDDDFDSCPINGQSIGFRQFQSLLNLTADLRIRQVPARGGFILEGSAVDKHLESYQLQYADVSQPDTWLSIAPPQSIELIDSEFTTWVPPYIGDFLVRLTVNDKAGNSRQRIQRVNNRERSSISGLFISESFFSPNGDGVKDTTELNFRVLENVNLDFQIFDESNRLVRSEQASFDLIGSQQSFAWDGRDNSGRLVEDGVYRIKVQDFDFFVTLDTTSPFLVDTTTELFVPRSRVSRTDLCDYAEGNDSDLTLTSASDCLVTTNTRITGNIQEIYLDTIVLQSRPINSGDWQDVPNGLTATLLDPQQHISQLKNSSELNLTVIDWRTTEFRFKAIDFAGNESILELGEQKRNKAHITSSAGRANGFGYGSHLGFGLIPDYAFSRFSDTSQFDISFRHTATQEIQFTELVYSDPLIENSPLFSLPLNVESEFGFISEFNYNLDQLTEVTTNQVEVFVRLRLIDGRVLETDRITVVHDVRVTISGDITSGNGLGVFGNSFAPNFPAGSIGINFPTESVDRVVLALASIGTNPDTRYTTNDVLTVTTRGLNSETNQVEVLESNFRLSGTIILDDKDPSFVASNIIDRSIDRIIGGSIDRFSLNNAPTINDCGHAYRLEVYVFRNGESTPLRAAFEQSANCVDIRGVVRPNLPQQCNDEPTNQVTIFTLVFSASDERPFDPNVSDTTTPLLLQVGLPNPGDEGGLSEVLYAENFPLLQSLAPLGLARGLGDFQFELDTTSYPEGFLELRAVLVFIDGGRTSVDTRVPIVHSKPSIDITFPNDGDKVCAVRYIDTRVIEVDGVEVEVEVEVNGIEVQGNIATVGPDMLLQVRDQSESLGRRVSRIGELGIITTPLSSVNRLSNGIGDKRRAEDNILVRTAPIRFSPITSRVSSSGVLAIPEIGAGQSTLIIEATNWGSAKQCRSITIDADVEVEGLVVTIEGSAAVVHPPYDQLEVSAISPNSDELFDDIRFNYSVSEAVVVDVEVFSTRFESSGDDSPGTVEDVDLVAQPYLQIDVTSGIAAFDWNGRDDSDEVVSDGVYRVVIRSRDGCGHTAVNSFLVVVDTTPPSLEITAPVDGGNIAIQPRVFGNVLDIHPANYQLSISVNATDFNLLSQGDYPSSESESANPLGTELGQLNLFGQTGQRIIRLEAQDQVGNQSSVDQIFVIPERLNLITSITTTEYFVSPNADQRLDNLTIRVGFDSDVTASLNIRDSSQNVVRNLSTDATYSAGFSTLSWDGLNTSGDVPADNTYTVQVIAQGSGNVQTEFVTFELDNTPPAGEFFNVVDGDVQLLGRDQVFGRISDRNFSNYQLELVPQTDNSLGLIDPLQLTASNSATSGLLATIPSAVRESEEQYQLSLTAEDLAGNRQNILQNVVLDLLPPRVVIRNPIDGVLVNLTASPVALLGSVEDTFLRDYIVSIAPVSEPEIQTQIAQGNVNVDGSIAPIDLQGLADGPYVITVIATDRGGLSAAESVQIIVDNTPPVVSIDSPQQGAYVTTVQSILGAANDAHFSQYELSIANGHVAEEGVYQTLTTSSRQVVSGPLFNWSELPSDGQYTLQLTASDTPGNQATVYQQFTIDTLPPTAPILTSVEFSLADDNDVDVAWEPNTESDLTGYNLYRNGSKVNADLIVPLNFLDIDLIEGDYTYQVTAVDLAGLESELSNSLSILVDQTPPEVNISEPSSGERVSLLVDIIGTAFSENDFLRYRLFIGPADGEQVLVQESPLATQNDLLYQWDTTALASDSDYIIRLEAQDTNGNSASDEVTVFVDSQAPIAPENLSATIVNLNDAQVTWEYTGDISELAGFVLFRDGQVANSSGPAIGPLSQFAITGLSYLDPALADGRYEYQVFAIDLAGNLSEGSNLDDVSLDLGAPSAAYINIEEGQAFDESLYLLAGTPDNDIAEILMQYRLEGDIDWLDITSVNNEPYEHTWQTDALDDGRYEIRAVATDLAGNIDPNPAIIQIEKRDIEAPSQVLDLSVRVNQDTGILSWTANTEVDFSSYNIYRHDCSTCTPQLVTSGVNVEAYNDVVELDFEYYYSVTAVDEAGNEGQASELMRGVFTAANLFLDFLESVVNDDGSIQRSPLIFPEPEKNLEVRLPLISNPDNTELLRQLTFSDLELEVVNPLAVSNIISVNENPEIESVFERLSFDDFGVYQVSTRVSSAVDRFSTIENEPLILVYQGQPSVPTGLTAQADDLTNETQLSWSANPSEELVVGYRVIENGNSVNTSELINDASAFSESGGPIFNILPSSSFSRTWTSNVTGQGFGQRWAQPRLINRITLNWASGETPQDFDVFALLNGESVQIDSRTDNEERTYSLDIPNLVATTEIRVVVNRWNIASGGRLRRMSVFGEDLHFIPDFYTEQFDGNNSDFSLQAVNTYGGISAPATPIETVIGDGEPLLPVVLTVTAIESVANLSWTESEGANRYRVFQDGEFILETPSLTTNVVDLANGVYQYYVIAVNESGAESDLSNIAEAIINIALPASPIDLVATANNEQLIINLEWESFSQASSSNTSTLPVYNVYRSEASGTGFEQIGSATVAEFVDFNTDINTQYFYTVTELDSLGNESSPSNEADAQLAVVEGASLINLTVPTDETHVYITNNPLEDVGGVAPAAANVFLMHNDEFLTEPVLASSESAVVDLIEGLRAIDGHENGQLSDFLIDDQGRHIAAWSDNFGRQNLYRYADGQWQILPVEIIDDSAVQFQRLNDNNIFITTRSIRGSMILNLDDNQVSPVSISLSDSFFNRRILAYSQENQYLIINALRISPRERGIFKVSLDGSEIELLPEGQEFSVSPSGRYYAYREPNSTDVRLQVLDVLTDETFSMILPQANQADAVFSSSNPWSPDESKLILSTSRQSVQTGSTLDSLVVFDLATQSTVDVRNSQLNVTSGVWPSNNNNVIYATIENSDIFAIEQTNIDTGLTERRDIIAQSYAGPRNLIGVSNPGAFIFRSAGTEFSRPQEYREYSIAGIFTFNDVPLFVGSNRFSAIAVDDAGDITDPSAETEVIRQAQVLPDYSVELTTNPELPVVNSDASLDIIVSNDSDLLAEQTNLLVQVISPDNQNVLLVDQLVGPVAAGSSISVNVPWRPALDGTHTVLVEIDQTAIIDELDESNNTLIRRIEVFTNRGPDLQNQLGLSERGNTMFDINELVTGNLVLRNPGSELSGTVIVDVVDTAGNAVAVIESYEVTRLANGGEFVQAYTWSAVGTVLGDYFVRARLLGASDEVLTSDQDSFTLVEDLQAILGVRTNQFSYSSNEDVIITATTLNRSNEASLENARVRLQITSADGDLLFSQESPVEDVLAGDRSASVFSWNTGDRAPGRAQVTAVLIQQEAQQDTELATATTNFEIRPSALVLSGNLTIEDTELGLNQPLVFEGIVSNDGNLSLTAFNVRYLIRSEDGVVRSLVQAVSSIAPQSSVAANQSLNTDSLEAGRYRLVMQAEIETAGGELIIQILDDEAFSIDESTAPTVIIQQPTEGAILNSQGRQAIIFALDDSFVTRVDARFTIDEWFEITSSTFEPSRYSLPLQALNEGPQVLAVRAVDDELNESSITRRRFIIDNTPPTIDVQNITEDQIVTSPIVPLINVFDLHPGTQLIQLNGAVFLDGTQITLSGSYVLEVTATDLAGNTSTSITRFTADIDNRQPLNAVDDELPVSRGVFATINLLSNDSFNNLDDLDISIITPPTRGRVIRASNGVYNYSPSLLSLGLDSFVYQLTDTETGETSQATVRVDISPVASCSFVPDHSTRTSDGVVLINWAKNSEDLSDAPRYRINISGTSDDSVFVPGQGPRISFPDCSLSYTARANMQRRVTVRYTVTDVATNGRAYTSPIREFTLDINTRSFNESVIVPILQLLLLEDDDEQ